MLVNLACDWQRPSGNWPCAWRPSDYYRFLLSDSRNRFLSTDLQSAFWKLFGKEPSLGFPMDLTNLHALPNDQKAASRSGSTSHQLAFRPLHTRHQHLTDGLGLIIVGVEGAASIPADFKPSERQPPAPKQRGEREASPPRRDG